MQEKLNPRFVGKILKLGNVTGRQASAQLTGALKKTSAYMSQNPMYGYRTRVWIGGVHIFAASNPIMGGDVDKVASELEALGWIVERDERDYYRLDVLKPEWINA